MADKALDVYLNDHLAGAMMGSDLANRARDMLKGIDVLRGDPPTIRTREGRRAVVGTGERDLPLKMYAESWRQKIERNGGMNYPRTWADLLKEDKNRS